MDLFAQFRALIHAELSSRGDQRLSQVEALLSEQSGAEQVEFLDDEGCHIHGRTLFRKAMDLTDSIVVILPLNGPSRPSQQHTAAATEPVQPDPAESVGFTPSEPVHHSPAPHCVSFNEAFFIRDLDRRERERGDTWAGFVVKELLPGLGFSGVEAKRILRQLEAHGVVMTSTKPNPRNPDRPTTYVRLNRDHARVCAALASSEAPARRIQVAGGPVADTIVEERR